MVAVGHEPLHFGEAANPNLRRFEFELTADVENALVNFGEWWSGRLIATGEQLKSVNDLQIIRPGTSTNRAHYTLVTHHTKTDLSKEGIIALGGVLYVPDSEQTLFYGAEAGKQLRACLGVKHSGHGAYGQVKDGKTFVYLHPLPYELTDDARVYMAGPDGYALARAFSDNPPSYARSSYNLESVLMAPWETLDAWLTSDQGLKLIKKNIPELKPRLEESVEQVYRIRMIENKYLIAVI